MEFDAINDLFNQIDTDRPFLASFLQAIEDLDAVESLPSPILFHDQRKGILCSFARGKSFMATEAFPPSPDRIFILSQPGIDDFALGMTTKGTFHGLRYLCRVSGLKFHFRHQAILCRFEPLRSNLKSIFFRLNFSILIPDSFNIAFANASA